MTIKIKENGAKSKQQVVTEFRRREILDAARKVFARKGFADGLVDEIAAEAGVAKGTIYLYFPSKKDIYTSLLHNAMEELAAGLVERLDAAPELRQKIVEFALARLENVEAHQELFRIMDTQPDNLSFTRSQYHEWLRGPVLHLAAEIESAAKRGEVCVADPEKIAWAVADLARGAIVRRLLGHSETPLAEEANYIADIVWAVLRPATAQG
ncbi:MAG: TetR/AcrR family transcriptional regulator [Acidobacteriaceae bacterium]|nr:TetR/AcrR family transcriptional regulator [Acidobacteriaceae bacterium]